MNILRIPILCIYLFIFFLEEMTCRYGRNCPNFKNNEPHQQGEGCFNKCGLQDCANNKGCESHKFVRYGDRPCKIDVLPACEQVSPESVAKIIQDAREKALRDATNILQNAQQQESWILEQAQQEASNIKKRAERDASNIIKQANLSASHIVQQGECQIAELKDKQHQRLEVALNELRKLYYQIQPSPPPPPYESVCGNQLDQPSHFAYNSCG